MNFDIVKCPKGYDLSGAAVCAMILGKTLAEVLEEVDYRTLYCETGIQIYLGKYDWVTGTNFTMEGAECLSIDKLEESVVDIEWDLVENQAIFEINESRLVFWTGSEILDPSDDVSDSYEISAVIPLTKRTTPLSEYINSYPKDWRDLKS